MKKEEINLPNPIDWKEEKECFKKYYLYKNLKIYSGVKTDLEKTGELYELVRTKNNLYVSLADGMYEILELQPEGKKRMSAKDFINGNQNESKIFLK